RMAGGGDARTQQPTAVVPPARRRIAPVPAEPIRPLPQTGDEVPAREAVTGFRVELWLIANTQLDRVEGQFDCQLVHRGLECVHAGALAGSSHPEGRRYVEGRNPGGGAG